ncbi:MAG TPA: SCO family protein [Candidatus Thiothrix moscowensis]|uniref:SCO family protein n=1 Tax=unclassified Thiothrix TaxID=2636184 RepID=UPI0025CFABFB|nr:MULTISPECIES: SCO family protein [unclassified Thiothrix]HRJ51393.1 SCO family protein [Candidatus Thiothrix moscowensis]HRJ91552.1 SCO family protein [Candidatus Thiothrix moscowensis]
MMSAVEGVAQPPKRSNRTLWILIAVCAFPYLAGWLYFQFRAELPVPATTNFGTLLSPVRAVGDLPLVGLDGATFNTADLRGKWVLMTVADSACAAACQKNLYNLRQVRKAMGNERRRVERLLVLTNTDSLPALQAQLHEHEGMKVAKGPTTSVQQWQAVLPNPNPVAEDGLYILDPLGNVMMSYPPDFNGELIIKDLRRLLKVSQVG